MSVAITTEVWKLNIEKISKYVLLKISDNANEVTNIAFPSVAYLAAFCGMSERTVQRVLSDFVKSGVLVVIGHEKGGRRPREYMLDLEKAREIHGVIDWKKRSRGDSVSPLKSDDERSRGDSVSPQGCQPVTPGVTQLCRPRSDTAMSPEPSLNRHVKEDAPAGARDPGAAPACALGNASKDRLIERLGANAWKAWLCVCIPDKDDGQMLTLAVSTAFIRDYVVKNFLTGIEEIVERKVTLVVRPWAGQAALDRQRREGEEEAHA